MKLFLFYSALFLMCLLELVASLIIDPDFYKMGNQFILDQKLIYRHKPNYKSGLDRLKNLEDFFINSLGFRGPQPDSNKKDIIILGDSMVFGHGVSQEETFSQLLRAKVEANILNAGVKGYGTDQSLLLLREVIEKRKISVVIFSFNYNDLYDNVIKKRLESDGLKFISDETFFASTFNWFYQYLFPAIPSRLLQYSFTKGLLLYSGFLIREEMDLKKEKQKIIETFRAIDKMTKKHGITTIFLVMPNVNRPLEEFDFLKGIGLSSQMIMPHFDKQKYFIDSDIHFSPEGHQKMANILYDTLVDYDVLIN